MNNLNRRMARGALWMGLTRFCVRGIGLLSTVILARLLVPADFGLVAMAMSIIAFLQLATAFSFDIPLIQKQEADRDLFDSAWTLNVIFYALLTIVLLLLAGPAAAFYQESRLTDVIYVLAAGFLVEGFENIGVVYFRKELDFRKDFILMLSKKVVGFAVTIPLAFLLRSYWALIAGMVLGTVFSVALSYVLHPFRPRFALHAAGELFRYSKWLMLNNIINFLRLRSPDFLIGRMMGTSALGIFSIAYEISTLPTTELVAPVNRAVFPGYSKLAGNITGLRRSYVDVLALTAIVALPAGFGLAAVAAPLIDVALGGKWSAAAPIVGILALYGGIISIQSNTGSVFNAIGKPHLITLLGVISTTVLLGSAIVLALQFGPVGVAIAYLGTAILMAPIIYYYVCRETELRYRDLVRAIWHPFFCSLLMYGAIWATDARLTSATELGSAVRLPVLVALGAVVYTALMLVTWLLRGRPESAEFRLARVILNKVRGGRTPLAASSV